MEVSVESVSGLKRRVSVSIPNEKIEQEVQKRLRHLASRAKLDGFRPGKAPLQLVKKRYSESIRVEVAQGLLEETLQEALQKKALSPVSSPAIEKFEIEPEKDFSYTVSFEVLPAIEVSELDKKTKVEWCDAEVKETDIDTMIEKLRAQNKSWQPATRAAKKGDQAVLDFKGTVDGELIEQGEATHFSIEIGSGQMIPGFEEGLTGHKAGESFTIEVTFPETYQEEKLAGKLAKFDIHLHEVNEGVLAEITEAFVQQFGVESGQLADLRQDIRANMERELQRKLREMNHEACFDALATVNAFELPQGLIDKEIEHLKHEMYHRIFGPKHSPNEKIPDFPTELFQDRAKKRVHLGLLFAEYVKKHGFIANEAQVEAMMDRFSTAYSDPEEFKAKCRADKEWLAELEAVVVEQMVAEKIRETVTVKDKKLAYDEVMNAKQPNLQNKELT